MARIGFGSKNGGALAAPLTVTSPLVQLQLAFRRLRRVSWRHYVAVLLATISPDRLVEQLYRFRPYRPERHRWQDTMRWAGAPSSVVRLTRSAKRRLWGERSLTLVARNLAIGLTVLIAALLIDTFLEQSVLSQIAVLVAFGFLVRGLISAARSRPSDWQTLRAVDLRLRMRQQLATALEMTHNRASGLLADRQQRGAIDAARNAVAYGGLPIEWPRREVLVAGALILTTTAIIVAQPYVDLTGLRGNSASEQAALEMARLQALEAELGMDLHDEVLTDRQPRNLAEAIQQLLNRIMNPNAVADQALMDLAVATETIQDEYTQSILSEAALQQLADAWRAGAATHEIADALQRADYDAAAAGMEAFADRLPEMSADARQQAADGLKDAAQRAQSFDQSLSNLMQQTGRALETGDDRAARDRMSEMAQATRQVGDQVENRDALSSALDSLMESQLAIRSAEEDMAFGDMDPMGMGEDGMSPGQAGQEGRSGQTGQQQTTALGSAGAAGLLGQARASDNLRGSRDPSETGQGEELNVRAPGQGGNQIEPGAPDPNAIPTRGGGSNRPVEPGYQGTVRTAPDSNLVPWNLRQILRRYFSQPEPRR